MSLCAYCAAPLGLEKEEVEEGGEDPDLARIAKVPAHETYAAEVATAPPEGPEWQSAGDLGRMGITLVCLGLGVDLISMLMGSSGLIFHGICFGVLVWGALTWTRSRQQRSQITSQALLTRPAKIMDRRSETSLEAGGTSYFFTLKFEDGNTTEVRRPGRGSAEEVYAKGICGLAFTRGDELLEFRSFRV
jgi:hypothetical protein